MSRKVRLLLASGFLALGFVAVMVARDLVHTDAEWEAQLRGDTETALSIFAEIRNGRLPLDLAGQDDLWRRWETRMRLYDDAHRAELARRLRTYVRFIEAEHADAAAIYRNGSVPATTSDAARAARAEVRDRMGDLADQLLEDADALREEAYAASPALAGLDPDQPDFVLENERVRTWAPPVLALIERLTADPDNRTER